MPSLSYVVVKLLMLKLLLACISGLLVCAYEYGYHPSAEEFDNLRIGNRARTWTRDLLANQRRNNDVASRRMWGGGGEFVPKFSYERERDRHANMLAWQDQQFHHELPQLLRPSQNHHNNDNMEDPSAAASMPVGVMVSGDEIELPSSLEFNMFSDEVLSAQPTNNRPLVLSNTLQRPMPSPPAPPPLLPPKHKPNGVTIIEIASSEISNSVAAAGHAQTSTNKNSSDDSSLPIFFTNPETGVVYAITEIGRVQGNVSSANGSIPIYITKEQYNRDVQQLHAHYQRNCRPANNQQHNETHLHESSFSSATANYNTTVRPQIIHLQQSATLKPIISKLPTFELPMGVHKPATHTKPTTTLVADHVKKALNNKKINTSTISSIVAIKKQTNRKRKRKNKNKPKPPGLRPTVMMETLEGPKVVRGTHTKEAAIIQPSASTLSLHTQLEKPNLPASTSTIFSKSPFVSKRGYMSANHRARRSTVVAATPKVVAAAVSAIRLNGTKAARHTVKTPKPRKPQRRTTTNTGRLPQQPKEKPSGNPMNRWHNALMLTHLGDGFHNNSNESTTAAENGGEPKEATVQAEAKMATTSSNARKKLKRKKNSKGDDGDDEGVDLLDLIDELTGSKDEPSGSESKNDDDSYDDEENDDDDDDDVPARLKTTKQKASSSASTSTSGSTSGNDDDDDESSDDLHEDITQSNSSSAEESADFGALEEEEQAAALPGDDDEPDIIWTTKKNTAGKKRIRRRPPALTAASKEDYDDDYDDGDGGGGGGVSNFFRMLFYPVQAMMSRFFAVVDDGDDEDVVQSAASVQYPTYTLYHNSLAHPPNALSDEQTSDEQGGIGSSITDWFGSWFGFNRRTKNIGSTTKAPSPIAPQAPPPTQRPSSWLESWFGFGTSAENESSSDAYDKWFSSWFDAKPKARRRTTTTTTPAAAAAAFPQVPILTIVDPLKNPQNWIGILAHHLVNSTTTTTHNPLMEAFTRATKISTTTENPDIPRRISYDKYQIWRLKPQDDAQVQVLDDYKRGEEGVKLQWLKGPSLRGLTDVLVPPKMLVDFRATLTFENIAYEVLIFDVGKAIAYESKATIHYNAKKLNNTRSATTSLMSWHKYHSYDNIIKYLEWLRVRYPQLVELVHIGRSYEGRPLIIVKLELQRSNAAATANGQAVVHKKLKYKKKSGHANAVFIEAGTHGLEWIGPATATWLINELLRIMRNNNNKTSEEHEFIRKTTWYIMPVLNPDGYAYSHEYDRFWRKTRSRHVTRANGIIDSAMNWLQQKRMRDIICYGVDLDRNWAYQWGARANTESACNEFYTGPIPFSEPETKSLSEFLIDQRKRIKLYISLQAYGQVVSFPIRANASFNSERMNDFLDVAMVGTDGLRKKGSKARYKVDTTSDLIEHRSGCSDAFAAYEVGVPFSFTIQLADNGVHGYLLPSSIIEPTARDTFEIITAMLDYI